jgi:hypothetical protein
MDKRRFLAAAAAAMGAAGEAGAAAPTAVRAAGDAPVGPGLLTVAGAVGRANRGPLDPLRDQLMVAHGTAPFERAWTFDAAALARLPAVTIEPTLEYDGKPHRLSGPRLATVLEQAGVAAAAPVKLLLRAVDGYNATPTLAEATARGLIVATTLDGVPMDLGGLGPLWAVHDADRLPGIGDKPLKERFAGCPWSLYFIGVQPA